MGEVGTGYFRRAKCVQTFADPTDEELQAAIEVRQNANAGASNSIFGNVRVSAQDYVVFERDVSDPRGGRFQAFFGCVCYFAAVGFAFGVDLHDLFPYVMLPKVVLSRGLVADLSAFGLCPFIIRCASCLYLTFRW